METEKLNELFKDLKTDFDLELPREGHQQRFLEKLTPAIASQKNMFSKQKTYAMVFSVAASLLLIFGPFIIFQRNSEMEDLASVSPELSKTQDFFTTVIASELTKINSKRSPENDMLVVDALKQIELLENTYQRLKGDLKESGQDKRVIFAMISNYQSRIEILENLLKTLEKMHEVKNQDQTLL